jgi:hypothetical protein
VGRRPGSCSIKLLSAAVALGVTLVLSAAAPASVAHAQPLTFDWTMPPKLSAQRDRDGLIDYATPPEAVRRDQRWPVRLQADGPCVSEATYRWIVVDEEVAEGEGKCSHLHVFPREGTYGVVLEREHDGRTERTARAVVVQNWLVVGMGDSVGSGEGNPDVPGGVDARWQDERCHRSAHAGVARAARRLEEDDHHTSVTFVHLACSGATIRNGIVGPYAGAVPRRGVDDLPPQASVLDALAARGVEIDAAVIHVGANDVYFAPIARFCAFRTKCWKRRFDRAQPLDKEPGRGEAAEAVVSQALANLHDRYDEMAAELPPSVGVRRVHLVEYFDPTRGRNGDYCRRVLFDRLPFFGIDRKEIRWADQSLLAPLNEAVHRAAERNRWRVVDGVARQFDRHGYCAGRERWIRTLTESLFKQGGSPRERMLGTLHPNRLGHDGIAERIYMSLRDDLYPDGRLRPPDPAVSVAATTDEGDEDEQDDRDDPRWDPEETAASGVGGGIIAGAAVALIRAGRRRRPAASGASPPGRPAWMNALPEVAGRPEVADRSPAAVAGPTIWRLLATSNEWINRRVETVALTAGTIRRRVSVDFTLPMTPEVEVPGVVPPGHYAPLALLGKEPLTSFDLRDAQGAALPMMTRAQTTALGTAALVAALEAAAGVPVGSDVRGLLRRIVDLPFEAGGRDALVRLRTGDDVDPALRRAAREDAAYGWLEQTLAGGFTVVAKVAAPEERQIVKFSYDSPVEPVRGRRAVRKAVAGWVREGPRVRPILRWLGKRLAWSPYSIVLPVPDVGGAASYHFELQTQGELEVVDAGLLATRAPPASIGPVPGKRVHMYVTGSAGSRGFAWGLLRAERHGPLFAALVLAGITTLLLAGAAVAAPTVKEAPDTLPPLLLAVPGALAAFLSRPNEDWLTRRLRFTSRAMLLGVGVCSVAGAALAGSQASTATLEDWLPFLAVASANLFLLLLVTYIFPRPPRDDRDGE